MPPVGYKRSRALWDQTKRPEASWNDWLKAFLYELQPIRFSRASQQETLQLLQYLMNSVLSAIRSVPPLLRHLARFLGTRIRQQWMIVGGVVVYYLFVRWIHNLLHAGPLVIIATSLCIIFSFGLSDSTEQNGISAYSVFNRGFERLMGAVDAEALVAQHVGGGMAMGAAAMPAAAAPPRQRVNVRQPPPARAQPVPPENPPRVDGEEAPVEEENQARPNRARKSGKKNRRRMEQRQELRRQREAAAAFGMNGDEDEQEMMAMQRLLEEQIAAENA